MNELDRSKNPYYKDYWFDLDVEPDVGDFIENSDRLPCLVLSKAYKDYENFVPDNNHVPFSKDGDLELLIITNHMYKYSSCSIKYCAPRKIKKEFITEYLVTMPHQRYILENWKNLGNDSLYKTVWKNKYGLYKKLVKDADDLFNNLMNINPSYFSFSKIGT